MFFVWRGAVLHVLQFAYKSETSGEIDASLSDTIIETIRLLLLFPRVESSLPLSMLNSKV